MIGRNIARKVTRNLTHPIGLGWSLGAAVPDAGISAISSAWGSYAYINGFTATGDYVYTPDSTNVSITGNISLVSKSALDDWTPTSANTLINKDSTVATGRSYSLSVQPSGVLRLTFSTNGTAVTDVDSTVATGFADGSTNWAAVERNSTTGDVRFYISADGVTWVQLGATVTAATGAIFDSTTDLQFGNLTSASMLLAGKIFVNQVWSGFAVSAPGGAAKKIDFNAQDWRSDRQMLSTGTGEIWTWMGNSSVSNTGTITFGFTSSAATISKVDYGIIPGVYPWTVNNSTPSTTHSLTVGTAGGIDRRIAYYYRIGVSTDGGATWQYSAGQVALPPAPIAKIMAEAEILPKFYRDNNNYFPASVKAGYTGIRTYEGYAPHAFYISGWNSFNQDLIADCGWDWGAGTESSEGGRYQRGINAIKIFDTAGTYAPKFWCVDYLGRYSEDTITVIVHDSSAGATSMDVGTVNVPGGTYAITHYWLDATNGNDTWNGKAQAWDGTNGPWKTLTNVRTGMFKTNASAISTWTFKPGDKILGKAGDVYYVNDVWPGGSGKMVHGVHFGKWGTGANPKMQYQTPAGAVNWTASTFFAFGTYIISPTSSGKLLYQVTNAAGYTSGTTFGGTDTSNCKAHSHLLTGPSSGTGQGHLTITDWDFNLNDGTSGLVGLWYQTNQARNVYLARCVIKNPFNSTFYWEEFNTTKPMVDEPYGLGFINCSFDQIDIAEASTVLGVFGGGAGLGFANCKFDRSGNHMHYLAGVKGAAFTGNTYTRPAFGRTALRLTGGKLNSQSCKVYCADSKFIGWIDPQSVDILGTGSGGSVHNGVGTSYNYMLVQFSHNDSADHYLGSYIFERNFVSNFSFAGMQTTNAKNGRIRRNIFATPAAGAVFIRYGDSDTDLPHNYQQRALDDILTNNNTFAKLSTAVDSAEFLRVCGTKNHSGTQLSETYHKNLRFANNLAIAMSNHTAPLIYFERDDANQIPNTAVDNNLLDSASTNWVKTVSTTYTLASWQAAKGLDLNSLKTAAGVVTPPSPISHSPGLPASQADCIAEANSLIASLRLASGSAAINAGADDVLNWLDYDGNPVPVGAHTDIGAFEKQ